MSASNLLIEINESKNRSHTYYLLVLALGFSIFPIITLNQKFILVYLGKYSSNEYIFLRSIILALISLIMLKKSKKSFVNDFNKPENMKFIILRNIFNFFQTTFFLLSLNYLRVSTASIFTCLGPVFNCIGCVIFLKEKFYLRYLVGLIACIIGTFLVVLNEKDIENTSKPANSISLESFFTILLGGLFGIFHAISYGIQGTLNKKLLNMKIDSNVILFFMGLILSSLSLFFFVLNGSNITLITNIYFIMIVCLDGVLIFILLSLINYSTSNIDLISSTGISYIMVVESFIFGIFFFGDTISFTDVFGCLIIIFYNLYHVLVPLRT